MILRVRVLDSLTSMVWPRRGKIITKVAATKTQPGWMTDKLRLRLRAARRMPKELYKAQDTKKFYEDSITILSHSIAIMMSLSSCLFPLQDRRSVLVFGETDPYLKNNALLS
jgi:hypothetical protein